MHAKGDPGLKRPKWDVLRAVDALSAISLAVLDFVEVDFDREELAPCRAKRRIGIVISHGLDGDDGRSRSSFFGSLADCSLFSCHALEVKPHGAGLTKDDWRICRCAVRIVRKRTHLNGNSNIDLAVS